MSRTGHFKSWTLSDGQSVKVEDVMKKTGLSYTGSASRLKRFSKPEDVFAPRKQQGIPKGTTLKRPKEWVNEPDKICAGIPYDSAYMDGNLDRNGFVYDRYGNIMSTRQRKSLANYRDKLRQQWLNNREVIK